MRETMNEEVNADGAPQTRLKVSHPEEGSVMGRGLNLTLDRKDWAHLKAGRDVTAEIEPGHHRLRVDNTYHKKMVEFDAKPGELVHYRITNKVTFFGSMMLGVLGAAPMHLVIEREGQEKTS
jgi:hypothetical protein